MSRVRLLAPGLFAAGLLGLLSLAAAQPPPPVGLPPGAAPDPGLAVVPKESLGFVTVKVSEVFDHPDLKPVWAQLAADPKFGAEVGKMIGVTPAELDRVTLFWPSAAGLDLFAPVLVVTTRQPYNEARVVKNLQAEPASERQPRFGPGGAAKPGVDVKVAPKTATPDLPPPAPLPPQFNKELNPAPPPVPKGGLQPVSAVVDPAAEPDFYLLDRRPWNVLLLVDDRTLAFLPDPDHGTSLVALVGQLLRRRPTGPLADALARANAATAAAGFVAAPLTAEFRRNPTPALAPYSALLSARTIVLTGDLKKSARLTLRLDFDDPAAARRAAPVLEEGVRELVGKIGEGREKLKDGRGPDEAVFAPVLDAVTAGLKKATVRAAGTAVEAAAEIDLGPAVLKSVAELGKAIEAGKRQAELTNNFKQVGLAMHNHEAAFGWLPTDIYSKDGKPLLSWRVAILPFVEEEALYRQFKMDEPWDSPANKALLERMPKVYQIPGRDAPKGHTFVRSFVSPKEAGPNRAWLTAGEPRGLTFPSITDGTSNTLAAVEAGESVPWTKPDDLPYDGKQPLPKLGGHAPGRMIALFGDGSVRVLDLRKLDETTLRALITVQGGEVFSLPDR